MVEDCLVDMEGEGEGGRMEGEEGAVECTRK